MSILAGSTIIVPPFDGNLRARVTIIASGLGEYASNQRSPKGYTQDELEEIAKISVIFRESRYQPHLIKMPYIKGGQGPQPHILQYGVQYGIDPYLWIEVEVPDKGKRE